MIWEVLLQFSARGARDRGLADGASERLRAGGAAEARNDVLLGRKDVCRRLVGKGQRNFLIDHRKGRPIKREGEASKPLEKNEGSMTTCSPRGI